LDDVVIVGLTMAVAELLKGLMRRRLGAELAKQLIPLVVLGLAGGLNVLNVAVFGPLVIPLLHALAEGLKLGAIAGGVYSLGKAALGMS
jgi:hypothetical protein